MLCGTLKLIVKSLWYLYEATQIYTCMHTWRDIDTGHIYKCHYDKRMHTYVHRGTWTYMQTHNVTYALCTYLYFTNNCYALSII